MNIANRLHHKTILITRPLGREAHLRNLLEQDGAEVVHYPVITIQPPSEIEATDLIRLRDQLHRFDMAIFISPTAVEQSRFYFPAFPEHFDIASIGSKTTEHLKQHGIQVTLQAPEHNSESMLKMNALQMPYIKGKKILIFRGTGGKALLGDTLTQRGAQIRYVETYSRQLPQQKALSKPQLDNIDAITVSSNEGLENLVQLVDDPGFLISIPVVVPSDKAVKNAREHGFSQILAARNATDEAMIDALTEYFSA